MAGCSVASPDEGKVGEKMTCEGKICRKWKDRKQRTVVDEEGVWRESVGVSGEAK